MASGGSGPAALAAKIQAALTGAEQVLDPGTTFQIAGAAMTPAQIAAQLATYLPAFSAVEAAKAKHQQALAARVQIEPVATEFLVNLRAALVAYHRRGNPVLTQFGMGTGQPGTPSPETQVVAAATRMLTRRKRGTLGKKQRQAINVVGPPTVTVGGAKSVVLPVANPTPPVVEAALAAARATSE